MNLLVPFLMLALLVMTVCFICSSKTEHVPATISSKESLIQWAASNVACWEPGSVLTAFNGEIYFHDPYDDDIEYKNVINTNVTLPKPTSKFEIEVDEWYLAREAFEDLSSVGAS